MSSSLPSSLSNYMVVGVSKECDTKGGGGYVYELEWNSL